MISKLNQEREKRKVLNQIRHPSLSGNKEGYFYAYMSENDNHIDLKYFTWKKLRKLGYLTWCEPIFKNGIRMDILAFRLGKWINVEILSSETEQELAEKIKKYPEIEVIKIKCLNDLDYLE